MQNQGKLALVCTDVQEGLVYALNTMARTTGREQLIEARIASIASLQAWCREQAIDVVHLAHERTDGKVTSASQTYSTPQNFVQFAHQFRPNWFAPTESAFDPRVSPLGGETVLCRSESDAFQKSDFATILRSRGIGSLFFTGALLEKCIRSTAESARTQGFESTIITDAILSEHDEEEVRQMLLSAQASGINIRTKEQLQQDILSA